MQIVGLDPAFWHNRRVFITGHTGFVGGWLALWLTRLGAEVAGYSLAPPTRPSFFEAVRLDEDLCSIIADIRDSDRLSAAMRDFAPEIVFHLAAQPLVRLAHAMPVDTFAVNVTGTANLMQAMRNVPSIAAAVIFTTDKVYDNRERTRGYREYDRLGGREPYGASKACAEMVVDAFRHSYFAGGAGAAALPIATVRAGNIVGGGDWASDRLVPDAIRAFAGARKLRIRRPEAIRPWQHVLDPNRGLLLLAQGLATDHPAWAGGWNLGPAETDSRSVAEVVGEITRLWGAGAEWVDEGARAGDPFEARRLTLGSEKAAENLSWRPLWPFERMLATTVEWYRAHIAGADMRAASLRQIATFEGTN
jgi:CDP-glucose 4,6-dehydratase